jgi:hypothetical protein
LIEGHPEEKGEKAGAPGDHRRENREETRKDV